MNNKIPHGFEFAGVSAGLYGYKRKDLGLILSKAPASVAGLFTKNKIQAAPVILDKERIKKGVCRAVVVNSGNANCCTGTQGMMGAESMTKKVGSCLDISEQEVLVASTGVIGQPFPIQKIKTAIPNLIKKVSKENAVDFAESIMTTDTVPKVVSISKDIDGKEFTITGIAKGSGMIRPDMATMLCFIVTDIKASPDILKEALTKAADSSFNRITIDGDTSTNDTILILANSMSCVKINRTNLQIFQKALDFVSLDLARKLVKDGEGVTKLVKIEVKGAKSDQDARIIADTISHSSLVKTAFFGEDANWGRIIAAIGRSSAEVAPDKIDLFFDDIQMVKKGLTMGNIAEDRATQVLKKPEFTVTVDLNLGRAADWVLTSDFSVEYVKINADYRS